MYGYFNFMFCWLCKQRNKTTLLDRTQCSFNCEEDTNDEMIKCCMRFYTQGGTRDGIVTVITIYWHTNIIIVCTLVTVFILLSLAHYFMNRFESRRTLGKSDVLLWLKNFKCYFVCVELYSRLWTLICVFNLILFSKLK